MEEPETTYLDRCPVCGTAIQKDETACSRECEYRRQSELLNLFVDRLNERG
jgi:predicted nucleic acid-binding Zn ribbon protein